MSPTPPAASTVARLPALLHADPVSRHTRIILGVLAALLLVLQVGGYILEPWFMDLVSQDPEIRAELEATGEDPRALGPRSGIGLAVRVASGIVSVLGTLLFAWQPSVAAVAVLTGSTIALLGLVGPDSEHVTPQIFAGGIVLGAALVTRYSRASFAWICLAAVVVHTVLAELLVEPDTPEHVGEQGVYIVTLVVAVLVALPALAVRRSRHRERDRVAALEAAERRALEAAEGERQRIAAELHDVVAHGLTVISMQAAMLPTLTDPGQRRGAEEAIESAARQSLVDLRRMLTALRGTSRNEGTGSGEDAADLPARLAEFRAHLTDAGYRVSGALDGLDTLPESLRLTVLRVAQEATTNVLKHGPGAGEVTFATRLDGQGRLDLRVESPLLAPGSPAALPRREFPASGFGLAGMAERVSLFGGSVAVGAHGDRWVVDAALPTR